MYEWILETTEDADVCVCIVLDEVKDYLIGRRKGFDIVSLNPLVSRNHGVITVTPERQVFIKDLQSANGTFINDNKIPPNKPELLKHDDLLGIGAPSNATEAKKEIFWVRRRPVQAKAKEKCSYRPPSTKLRLDNIQCKDLKDDVGKIGKSHNLCTINNSVDYEVKKEVETNGTEEIKGKNNFIQENIVGTENVKKKDDETTACNTTNKVKKLTNELPNLLESKTVNSEDKTKNLGAVKKSNKFINSSTSKTEKCDPNKSTELPNTSRSKTVKSEFKNKNTNEIKKRNELINSSTYEVENSNDTNKIVGEIKEYNDFPITSENSESKDKSISNIQKTNELTNSTVNKINKYEYKNRFICDINKDSLEVPKSLETNTVSSEIKNINVCDIKKSSNELINSSISKTASDFKTKKVNELNKSFNEPQNSSVNKTVDSNSKVKNVCEITVDNSTSSKFVETSLNSNLLSNTFSKDNKDKNSISENMPKNVISDQNEDNISNKDIKLNVEYLNSLIQRNKSIKSFEEMIICSSDEEKSNDTKSNIKFDVKIKTEPKNHSFTQNDDDEVVIVSDDDDDIFPKSQIFGDLDVKREPEENKNLTSAGNYPSPSSDNNEHDNIFIKDEVQEYDYNDNDNEDDAFDDDDCIIWYNKLSQSQDLITSSQNENLQTSPDAENKYNYLQFDDKDLEIFDKHQEEESRESRICTAVTDINEQVEEHLTSKDVEPEVDDTINGGIIQKSCSSKLTKVDDVEPEVYDTTDNRATEKSLSSTLLSVDDVEPDVDDTTDSRTIEKSCSLLKLTSFDDQEEDKSSRKKGDSKKNYVKPPVIDAPFLKKIKRKVPEEPKSKDSSSSKSKRRKSCHDEVSATSSSSVNTAFQSSVLNIDKSVKNELDKRHKKRRKSTEIYTKNEKQRIQEDRKKKLKELASKASETKEKKEVQKHHTKPKVKVSSGRGLFLTENEPSSEKKKSDAPLEEEPLKKKYRIPRRNDSVSNDASYSKTNSEPNISKQNKLSFNNLITKEKEQVEPLPTESNVKKLNKLSFNTLISNNIIDKEPVDKTRKTSISNNNTTCNNNLNGILCTRVKKSGKRVTFKDEPEIRYIERIPGNSRKVNSKDAPIPLINNSRNDLEILSTILEWRPAWLEEQKEFNESPQVSKRKPIRMLSNFNNVNDYFDIVTPLMLLELWRSVFRDWCHNNSPVKLACIERIQQRPDGLHLFCYCLADKNDTDNYPRWGDLLVAEFYLADNNQKIATSKKFGYVTNINRRRMIQTDVVHKQFIEMGPVPQFKVEFTMTIKKLQLKIFEEKLMRIRLVSRISPQLRIFKPVPHLSNSSLCNFILKPSVQQYKVSKLAHMTSSIEDNLNNEQMVCVFEAYHICTRNEPGIYLIQGPPGTGKSYVIKNLIRQLICDATKSQNSQERRILLCAPSNGAIDEITNSLLIMRSKMPKNERFKMIRLGPPASITHPMVKSISVQDLVNKHIQAQQNSNLKTNSFMGDEYNFLIQKENTIRNKIVSMEARNLDYSLDAQKLIKVQEEIDRFKSNPNLQRDRRKQEISTEKFYLENAQIICTTLYSCVGSKLEELVAEKKIEFTCCIIDEATQSNEQESLIPLLLGIKRFVLVGDPEQLPPTIISHEAKTLGHGNSLFLRIQNCLEHLPDNPIRMLNEQYRMHPEICQFPSHYFYGGRLKTAEVIANKVESILDPCRLFCLTNGMDFKENEYLNKTEANLVLLLANIVVRRTKYNVGIITPYTKQKDYLLNKYSMTRAAENYDKEDHISRVTINTVDGFQGQERDVIIISSVRYKANIFLNDLQRLNVALTRAKHAVYICAHINLFKTDSIWKKLEANAKDRNILYALTENDATDEKYMSELIFT